MYIYIYIYLLCVCTSLDMLLQTDVQSLALQPAGWTISQSVHHVWLALFCCSKSWLWHVTSTASLLVKSEGKPSVLRSAASVLIIRVKSHMGRFLFLSGILVGYSCSISPCQVLVGTFVPKLRTWLEAIVKARPAVAARIDYASFD